MKQWKDLALLSFSAATVVIAANGWLEDMLFNSFFLILISVTLHAASFLFENIKRASNKYISAYLLVIFSGLAAIILQESIAVRNLVLILITVDRAAGHRLVMLAVFLNKKQMQKEKKQKLRLDTFQSDVTESNSSVTNKILIEEIKHRNKNESPSKSTEKGELEHCFDVSLQRENTDQLNSADLLMQSQSNIEDDTKNVAIENECSCSFKKLNQDKEKSSQNYNSAIESKENKEVVIWSDDVSSKHRIKTDACGELEKSIENKTKDFGIELVDKKATSDKLQDDVEPKQNHLKNETQNDEISCNIIEIEKSNEDEVDNIQSRIREKEEEFQKKKIQFIDDKQQFTNIARTYSSTLPYDETPFECPIVKTCPNTTRYRRPKLSIASSDSNFLDYMETIPIAEEGLVKKWEAPGRKKSLSSESSQVEDFDFYGIDDKAKKEVSDKDSTSSF